MDKILFYVSDWEEVKMIMPHYEALTKSYDEIAFSTDSISLVELLSVGKLLVVKHNTYYPSVTVSNTPLEGVDMSLEEFLEVAG